MRPHAVRSGSETSLPTPPSSAAELDGPPHSTPWEVLCRPFETPALARQAAPARGAQQHCQRHVYRVRFEAVGTASGGSLSLRNEDMKLTLRPRASMGSLKSCCKHSQTTFLKEITNERRPRVLFSFYHVTRPSNPHGTPPSKKQPEELTDLLGVAHAPIPSRASMCMPPAACGRPGITVMLSKAIEPASR